MTDRNAASNDGRASLGRFARHVLVVIGLVVLALFLWEIVDALLLAFAGLLLAVLLHGLASRLALHTPLPYGVALAVVGVGIIAVLVGGGWMLGPRVASQFGQLVEQLPSSVEQVRQQLEQYSWGEFVVSHSPLQDGLSGGRIDLVGRITGMASRVLNIVTGLVLIVFVGLFFAAGPDRYVRGLVRLAPPARRSVLRKALEAAGQALWKWLGGQFLAMLSVGVMVAVGLWLVGVELALVLGVITGLFNFVPYVGSTVAAVLGILLAFTQGPTTALYAALVYFAAQQIDGNLITPLIQREQVSLPPALILLATVAFGLLFGLIGVVLATPLAVVGMVLTKKLYIEEALEKKSTRDNGI